jgi:hypothetical protein
MSLEVGEGVGVDEPSVPDSSGFAIRKPPKDFERLKSFSMVST